MFTSFHLLLLFFVTSLLLLPVIHTFIFDGILYYNVLNFSRSSFLEIQQNGDYNLSNRNNEILKSDIVAPQHNRNRNNK